MKPTRGRPVDVKELEQFTFALITQVDHANKCTWLCRYEYGRLMDKKVYRNDAHYPLLISIIEEFRGKGCCDVAAHLKDELKNNNYWNRPLADPYSNFY